MFVSCFRRFCSALFSFFFFFLSVWLDLEKDRTQEPKPGIENRTQEYRSRGGRLTTRPAKLFCEMTHTVSDSAGSRGQSNTPTASLPPPPPPPSPPPLRHPLDGLVVRLGSGRSGVQIPLGRDVLGSNHTSGLKLGTPEATLPGAWHYRVSTGTGRAGVSIL